MMRTLAGALFVITTLVAAAALARPYTIEDHLKIEAVGHIGLTDPTGRWLVWEQTPPYDRFPDYGIMRFNALEGAGYRLMAVDLQAAKPAAALLFPADPRKSYWLDSFSPDGRYLVFHTSDANGVAVGVYDLRSRKLRSFDIAPAVKLRGGHRSIWISPEEFVLAALPAGVQPANIALRRYTGNRLWKEWQKAWQGAETSASEVTSYKKGETDTPLPGRLIRANARTGTLRVLADGLYAGLASSADGRYLAALRQFPRMQPVPGVADVDWVQTHSQLYLFDLLKGGEGRAVAPGKDVFPVTLAWANETPRLAFFAWDKGKGVRSGIFYALAAESAELTPYPHVGLDLVSERSRGAEKPERVMWIDGKLAVFARELVDPKAPPAFTYTTENKYAALKKIKPDWFLLTPQGAHEKLTASLQDISPIPVYADAHSLTVLADGAVWRVVAGEAPRKLTEGVTGTWAYPLWVQFNPDQVPFSGFASFVEEDEKATRVALVDARNERVSVVESPGPDATFIAGSAPRAAVLFRHRNGAVTHLSLRDASGKQQRLATLNAHLADITPSRWMSFKYMAQTHLGPRELASCALLPPDYQPGRRYPVIVDVYPGIGTPCLNASRRNFSALGESAGPLSEHLFAARGYIVLQPNTSSELIRTASGPISGMTDLVLQSVDAMVAQGYVDPRRLGLFGFSQGGFSSLWVATQTSRFNAVVSGNGWSDLYTEYFEGMIYQKFYADEIPYMGAAQGYEIEGGDFGLGANPYENPNTYLRNSALFNARKIESPLMMFHTDMDVFNLSQYEMMFTALYRQRKEAKFLRYWGEGHGNSSPANIRHSNAAILDWYDRWLDVARTEDGSLKWAGEYPASRKSASAQ